MDDGYSYKHLDYSERTLIEFTFDGNVIRAKALLKNDFYVQASDIIIDEIVIAGFNRKVASATKLQAN